MKSRQTLCLILAVVNVIYLTSNFLEGSVDDLCHRQDQTPCFTGGFRLDAATVPKAEAFFIVGELKHNFPKRSKSDLVHRTLLLRQIATPPKPKSNRIGCRHETMKTARDGRMARDSTE